MRDRNSIWNSHDGPIRLKDMSDEHVYNSLYNTEERMEVLREKWEKLYEWKQAFEKELEWRNGPEQRDPYDEMDAIEEQIRTDELPF